LINFLGADTTERSRKKLAKLAVEEIDAFCMQSFLKTIPAHFLKTVCASVKIRVGDCTSSNIIADCLIFGKNYEPTRTHHIAQPTLGKKPKSIKEGISKPDLIYWFTGNELKEYLDENGLKNGGKKAELAERILNFWDPEKENDTKGTKKARKGRKKKASRAPIEEDEIIEEAPKKAKKNKQPTEQPAKKVKGTEIIRQEPEKMDLDSDNSSSEESF